MTQEKLKEGMSCKLEVIKEASLRSFYKVRTSDGQEFNLKKFKFQENDDIPDYLDCFVKSENPLSIGQDIASLIKRFYKEGRDYDFKVKDIKINGHETHYDVEDQYGFQFKLFNVPILLNRGTQTKCKILKINGINVYLKYEGTSSRSFPLDFYDMKKWLDVVGHPELIDRFREMLTTEPEFQEALIKYNENDATWILEVLKVFSQYMSDWLIKCQANPQLLKRITTRLKIASDVCLYIIQESDYLKSCSFEQRNLLQKRLADYVTKFEEYLTGANYIIENTYEEFINKIFYRLKEAGYIYNPSRQISIMMTILKLQPKLINDLMRRLFEALHNWKLSNWESEPFRKALIDQLQIYIEENYGKVNILPPNDSSFQNKNISRMIIALAIQRILAREGDNIDLNLNRAIFYRYISYLLPKKVDSLLEKGIQSILGIESPNEFNWEDTETPPILFERSSHPFNNVDQENLLIKTFSSSKGNVTLYPDHIEIVGKGASNDATVIPNNMFEWLSPSISLADQIEVKISQKTKGLKKYKDLWDQIIFSLNGNSEDEIETEEKKWPENNDIVKVSIDDYRILKVGNPEERLQFHCIIRDEHYYGEGWMPCDGRHMIGWLRDKDYPLNFDGSLRFANSEDGSPLLFDANVEITSSGELQFKMNSQIEEYLLKTCNTGDEFKAIVTHFDDKNKVWLCLTEIGATFKIPIEDNKEELHVGKLVRVKCIEMERNSTTSLFFIGELSEDQSDMPMNIKKSECLFNLMQGLGDPSPEEENYEVVETSQVMSHEELMELIFILRRRAFSEEEYIKAYNYLGLVLVLCNIANDESLAEDVSLHMQLITFLQDFGNNEKLDMSMLEEFESKTNLTIMLDRLLTRLKIVANLGILENSTWLLSKIQEPNNEMERELASLVLSHNMLPPELESSKKDIKNEIAMRLKVNNTAMTSKYYGEESQTVEFKSSLIFKAGKHELGGGFNPEGQLLEITQSICAFMNARGGRLFIGVNRWGYENGLNDDLTEMERRYKVNTFEDMRLYLQNHLFKVLPLHARNKVRVNPDEQSKKGVMIVEVDPVRKPVELNGVIHIRLGSTKRDLWGDDEKNEFINQRPHEYQLLMAKMGISVEEVNPEEDNSLQQAESVLASQTISNDIAVNSDKAVIPTNINNAEDDSSKLQMGSHRPNVLHYWEDNYVEPWRYIYFKSGNKIFISETDMSLDYEEDCRLALTILEQEKDNYLILTFYNNKMLVFPVNKLDKLQLNQEIRLHKDSQLKSVNIASGNDYIINVIKNKQGNLHYRLERISDMVSSERIDYEGSELCELPHSIISQDIVKKGKISLFDKDAINREPRFFGIPLSFNEDLINDEQKISKLFEPLHFAL